LAGSNGQNSGFKSINDGDEASSSRIGNNDNSVQARSLPAGAPPPYYAIATAGTTSPAAVLHIPAIWWAHTTVNIFVTLNN